MSETQEEREREWDFEEAHRWAERGLISNDPVFIKGAAEYLGLYLLFERARWKEVEEALLLMDSAVAALLEDDSIECRGDEDCDHCVAIQAQDSARAALSRMRGEKG